MTTQQQPHRHRTLARAAILGGVALVFGLGGCGDGESESPRGSAPPVASDENNLTPEEAEHLAQFRTQQKQAEQATSQTTAAGPVPAATPADAAANASPKDEQKTSPAAIMQSVTGSSSPATTAPPTTRDKPQAASSHSTPRASAAASSLPDNAVVMRMHKITDPGMNNAVASTLLVPEGWTTEGGLNRPDNKFYSMPVMVDFKVQAPDGRGIHFFPSLIFQFDHTKGGENFSPTLDGNITLPLPESPGQWLMELAQLQPDPTITNLQLVSEEIVPELTEQLQKMRAGSYQQAQQKTQNNAWMNLQTAYDTQATKLVLRYEDHGQPIEETVLIVWQYNIDLKNGQLAWGTWSIDMMRSMRGKPGTDYLNDPVLAAVIKSIQINPAWQQEMNNYFTQLAQIRANGAAQRRRDWQVHNQKMQAINNDINNIIVGGHQRREAIRDAGYAKTIDAIQDVTPYTTPSGETVKLPSFYDHVYTDGNDRYILHNDAFYQPNTDPSVNSVNWERVSPQ